MPGSSTCLESEPRRGGEGESPPTHFPHYLSLTEMTLAYMPISMLGWQLISFCQAQVFLCTRV